MRTIIAAFVLILGVVAVSSAQSTQKIMLRGGEAKHILGSKLILKFLSVVEDSRCPPHKVCVWAGNARVKIQIGKKRDETREFELNTNLKPQTIRYKGYEVKIVRLSPKPGEDAKGVAARHTAVFEVTRL